jgi:hypothetical protein
VLAGWTAWRFAYPAAEAFLVGRLGGPAGAIALWLLLGAAMLAGYGVALAVGSRALDLRRGVSPPA